MRKTWSLLVVTAAMASAVTLGSGIAQANVGKECDHGVAKGDHDCHCRHHHRPFAKMAARLGLSEQQKKQVREIFKKGWVANEPTMSKLITERRNLRALIQADKMDEAAIRAQVAKVAAVEGDLAVERARVAGQIRAILTPAQVEKFKALQMEREKRFDKFRERIKERFDESGEAN